MRNQIDNFDREFADLADRLKSLIRSTSDKSLYERVSHESAASVGELVLRSAGAVEQMIGGITRRMWDDPFEWTLPEQLSSAAHIFDYVNEVERMRRDGFRFFRDDAELQKLIPAPVDMRSLSEILRNTLKRALSSLEKAEQILASLKEVRG